MPIAESFCGSVPERGWRRMEELILIVILAFIVLEIFKTIKK